MRRPRLDSAVTDPKRRHQLGEDAEVVVPGPHDEVVCERGRRDDRVHDPGTPSVLAGRCDALTRPCGTA